MAVKLPDPKAVASQEAERIKAAPDQFVRGPLERVKKDSPFVDWDGALDGVERFHTERMAKAPPRDRFPESPPWVAYVLAVDRELQALTGMSDREMAIHRSLGDYLTFRGYGQARPVTTEKCRVVFLPQTDRGTLHVKNVDDPITFWAPDPKPLKQLPWRGKVIWDGVGSGLHMDDEPEQTFPLPVPAMCFAHCADVPAMVEFLTRYSQFHGGGNFVLHDGQKSAVAVEKCSHNFIEVFGADASGGSHVSGMACRDPGSPQGRYQARQRARFLAQFKRPADSQEVAFWGACDRAERMLGELMSRPHVTVAEVLRLFTTPWPEGLNKTGKKLHPEQAFGEYTLITYAWLMDEGTVYRWQRSKEGEYPAEPEVYRL